MKRLPEENLIEKAQGIITLKGRIINVKLMNPFLNSLPSPTSGLNQTEPVPSSLIGLPRSYWADMQRMYLDAG